MNPSIKKRLLEVSLPTLLFVAVLYIGLYVVCGMISSNEAMCGKVSDLTTSPQGSIACSWLSIFSLQILFYVGAVLVPVVCLLTLLVFSSSSRVSAVERELKEIKEKLNA